MRAAQLLPREHVEVLLPPEHLGESVVCVVIRRVNALSRSQRLRADVQANPYACLNIVGEGAVAVPGRGALPKLFLTGPFTAPVPTEVAGALRSVSIVMQPWLLRPVFDRDAAQMVDRIVELDEVPFAGMQALRDAAAVLSQDPSNSDGLWYALENLLVSHGPITEPRLALDRLRAEGVAAAAHAGGIGERQYRRQFVRHMGLRPSRWVRISRLEMVLQGLGAAASVALGELALDAGYADQAHMSREARSLVRHSPGGLQKALRTEGASPWSLRPARPISSRRERKP